MQFYISNIEAQFCNVWAFMGQNGGGNPWHISKRLLTGCPQTLGPGHSLLVTYYLQIELF